MQFRVGDRKKRPFHRLSLTRDTLIKCILVVHSCNNALLCNQRYPVILSIKPTAPPSLARWCLRALEDSFPDCGFCRGPSLRAGDNGRKREGQMGMTHKTEALMELQLLKLRSLVKRLEHYLSLNHTSLCLENKFHGEMRRNRSFFCIISVCVCVCVRAHPPSSACSESRQAGKVGGRATFFLSSSLWSSLTAARRGLGAAASTVTSWKI